MQLFTSLTFVFHQVQDTATNYQTVLLINTIDSSSQATCT